jgi:hypothetical protein
VQHQRFQVPPPTSGREIDGVWTLGLIETLRAVDENAVEEWLPLRDPYTSKVTHFRDNFGPLVEQLGALVSTTAEEERAWIQPPGASDVNISGYLCMPMTPTPVYQQHIMSVVCATLTRQIQEQGVGVEIVPETCAINSVMGSVPSPLHKVKHLLFQAYRHDPARETIWPRNGTSIRRRNCSGRQCR